MSPSKATAPADESGYRARLARAASLLIGWRPVRRTAVLHTIKSSPSRSEVDGDCCLDGRQLRRGFETARVRLVNTRCQYTSIHSELVGLLFRPTRSLTSPRWMAPTVEPSSPRSPRAERGAMGAACSSCRQCRQCCLRQCSAVRLLSELHSLQVAGGGRAGARRGEEEGRGERCLGSSGAG